MDLQAEPQGSREGARLALPRGSRRRRGQSDRAREHPRGHSRLQGRGHHRGARSLGCALLVQGVRRGKLGCRLCLRESLRLRRLVQASLRARPDARLLPPGRRGGRRGRGCGRLLHRRREIWGFHAPGCRKAGRRRSRCAGLGGAFAGTALGEGGFPRFCPRPRPPFRWGESRQS